MDTPVDDEKWCNAKFYSHFKTIAKQKGAKRLIYLNKLLVARAISTRIQAEFCVA